MSEWKPGAVRGVLVPHPPVLLPEIGKDEQERLAPLTNAYKKAVDFLKETDPDVYILITPHIPAYSDYIQVVPGKEASGNLYRFGDRKDFFHIVNHPELVAEIEKEAGAEGIRAGTLGGEVSELDHGSMVPLYFFEPGSKPVVRIGVGGLSFTDHARLGKIIDQSLKKLGLKGAVIASGDLSHCQKADGPYGLDPAGPAYDAGLMEALEKQNLSSVLSMEKGNVSKAMSCGHEGLSMLIGSLDKRDVKTDVLYHEAPYGVGYGVVLFEPGAENPENQRILKAAQKRDEQRFSRISSSPELELAWKSIASQLFPEEEGLKEEIGELKEKISAPSQGVFVTLHENGELRGCIGTMGPRYENLADEIEANALSAAFHDPRFLPLQDWELEDVDLEISLLSPLEPIDSPSMLDPRKYGVLVKKGGRSGVLLPDLEGIDTVEKQLTIAAQKGGIDLDENPQLFRFTTKTLPEES